MLDKVLVSYNIQVQLHPSCIYVCAYCICAYCICAYCIYVHAVYTCILYCIYIRTCILYVCAYCMHMHTVYTCILYIPAYCIIYVYYTYLHTVHTVCKCIFMEEASIHECNAATDVVIVTRRLLSCVVLGAFGDVQYGGKSGQVRQDKINKGLVFLHCPHGVYCCGMVAVAGHYCLHLILYQLQKHDNANGSGKDGKHSYAVQ